MKVVKDGGEDFSKAKGECRWLTHENRYGQWICRRQGFRFNSTVMRTDNSIWPLEELYCFKCEKKEPGKIQTPLKPKEENRQISIFDFMGGLT